MTLLTTSEIARKAGVTRQAVTNWKSRHASFPKPVAQYGKTSVYDADEVAVWLES